MKIKHYTFLLVSVLYSTLILSQTKGLIYKPASTALGRSVLDPNGDSFSSLTSAGFSGTDYGSASELKMIPLPCVTVETVNDLTTGSSGGHTDIASFDNNNNQSCYIIYKTVGGIDYLIIRFRIGGASTAPKGYSFLMDTDGTFGTVGTNGNPGFDKEVVLQTGSGGLVAVYTHTSSTTTAGLTFPVDDYSQRSIALSTSSGDADYFYDFFIPYSALGLTAEPVRIAAATITSAGSGISGSKSDFNGINDALYGNDPLAISKALVLTFPATPLTSLVEGYTYASPKTIAPVVNEGITTTISPATTTISGISSEGNGTVITVYKNGSLITTANPVTVNNNTWTQSGVLGLNGGDLITSYASANGKTISDISNTIVVSSSTQECYIPSPLLNARNNTESISGTYSGSVDTATSIRIQLYTQIGPNATDIQLFNPTTGGPFYVAMSGGTWSVPTLMSNSTFNSTNFIAKAVSSTCVSGFSNVSKKAAGSGSGTITPKPTVTTSPIYQSNTTQTITVSNNGSSAVAAILILYINAVEVSRTTSAINPNVTYDFSVTALSEGDVITSRAQGTTVDYWLSDVSNSVTVQLNTPTPTLEPIIKGTYTTGSGKTITGTSTEPAGTEIKVYKTVSTVSTLLGTTTVTAFGTWQITGITLTTSDVLTATAKANNKSLSLNSNSVTVQASAPAVPTVSGSYVVGNTSISGTGGNTLVRIYVDGSFIGTATPTSGNWTLSSLASTDLYRGAVIHATNIVNGIESANSPTVTVTGVVSFCITITDLSGNAISQVNSGQTFKVIIKSKSAVGGCSASDFTSFTSNANLSSNKWFDPSGPSSNFTSGVLTLTSVVLGGVGTATINAVNPNDPSVTGSATITIANPAIWVGTSSTDFNTASNWLYNYVPGPNATIQFATNAVRDCHLDSNRIIGDLDFNNSSYKLNLNGKKLELRGQISNRNTSTGSWISSATSELEVKGYGNTGTLDFATGSEILNLTLNNTSSGALTLGSTLAIRGVLNIVNGDFTAGNALLTFKSNATNTAIVWPVTGSITGNVIVERYYPAKRAFRLVTSPVTTTTTIKANWQEGVNNTSTDYSLNQNPNLGFGTHITGDITSDKGFDKTNTTNSSMYKFDYLTDSWVAVPNTNVLTFTAGEPYRLMIRGDRSINYNTNNPTATNTTLRTTGALFTGTKTYDFSSIPSTSDYLFIGNPYQSPVDSKKVLKASTGLTNNFLYYWDPSMNTRGAFVTLSHSELDQASDVKSMTSSQISRYMQPGQAAFVKKATNATSASVVFQESHKYTATTATNTVSVFRNINNSNLQDALLRIELFESQMYQNQQQPLDGLVVRFNLNYSNNIDDNDAPKFNNLDEDFSSKIGNNYISILSNNFPLDNEEIPLYTTKYRNLNYKLVTTLENYEGYTPFIYDAYTQQYSQINGGRSTFDFTVSPTIPATIATDRFKIVFQNSNLSMENNTSLSFTMYPNPSKQGVFDIAMNAATEDTKLIIYNTIGQEVYATYLKQTSINHINPNKFFAKGVYYVKIKKDTATTIKKLIIE